MGVYYYDFPISIDLITFAYLINCCFTGILNNKSVPKVAFEDNTVHKA